MDEIIKNFENLTQRKVLVFDDFQNEYDILSEENKLLKSDKMGQTVQIKSKLDQSESTMKIYQTSNNMVQMDVLRDFHRVLWMDHPNLITYNDIYYWSEKVEQMVSYTMILKMESYPENLDQELTRRKQSKDFLCDMDILMRIKNCIDALKYLGEKNLNHMNIKPANIFIDSEGTVKLADFSFTKERSKKAGSVTFCKIEGANDYSSPECKSAFSKNFEDPNFMTQMRPEKADVYSLGLSLVRIVNLDDEKRIKGLNDRTERAQNMTNNLCRRISSKYFQNIFINMLKHDVENRCNINQLQDILKQGRAEVPRF